MPHRGANGDIGTRLCLSYLFENFTDQLLGDEMLVTNDFSFGPS